MTFKKHSSITLACFPSLKITSSVFQGCLKNDFMEGFKGGNKGVSRFFKVVEKEGSKVLRASF